MSQYNILGNYRDWLENDHHMPAGKKKTLMAAIELFSQQGYNGTSTAQIARTAGVSQATIFKYFKTKSELLSEIMRPMIPELKSDFLPLLQTHTQLEDAIHFIIRDRFQFLTQNVELIKILIQECLVNSQLRQELLNNMQQTIMSGFTTYWQTLKEHNPQINIKLKGIDFVRTNIGLLFAYFVQRFILDIPTKSEEEDLDLLEKQILTLLTC